MKRTGKRLGFTLVELLVVVAILGVLAALIIPRFLSQTKRAGTGEAIQMIGAMKRTYLNYKDSGGAALALSESSSTDSWEKFGMKKPNSKLWYYRATIPSSSSSNPAQFYAIYIADGIKGGYNPTPNTYMLLQVTSDGTETWGCSSGMQKLYGSADKTLTIGCQFS